MKLSRTSRFVAAVVAVISLLFTQLAMASYACPAETTAARTAMAAADMGMDDMAMDDLGMADMEHCSGSDQAQPSLCHAHTHSTPQSLNKPDLPSVPPFLVIGPILAMLVPDDGVAHSGVLTAMPSLAHATGPALAIRDCCFLI